MKRTAMLIGLILFSLRLSAQPQIGAVVSAADFRHGFTYGSLASIFGTGLSDGVYQAQTLPLPVRLGPTEVLACEEEIVWDHCIPQELIYVSPEQINFAVMDELPGRRYKRVIVKVNESVDSSVNLPIGELPMRWERAAQPRIFEMGYDCAFDPRWGDASTCGVSPFHQNEKTQPIRGALTDLLGTLVSSQNPARIGEHYSLWLTGLRMDMPGIVSIEITGIPVYGFSGWTFLTVKPSFIGESQFRGLTQINLQIPSNLLGVDNGPTSYPPLHPCGVYEWELSLDLERSGQKANLIQIPVLIEPEDGPCITQ